MYISITKQHLNNNFSQSSSDFVDYLEKENEGVLPEMQEPFLHSTRSECTCDKLSLIFWAPCARKVTRPVLEHQHSVRTYSCKLNSAR